MYESHYITLDNKISNQVAFILKKNNINSHLKQNISSEVHVVLNSKAIDVLIKIDIFGHFLVVKFGGGWVLNWRLTK